MLIADQHPLNRTAIKSAIKLIYPKAIFSESEDGASSLLILSKENIQLAIIDENLPILNGIDVIEKYQHSKLGDAEFILVSDKHHYNNYQKGIQLGVKVFIDKDHIDHELKYGLRAIQNGTKFLCGCLTQEISTINSFVSKVAKLSTKERIFLAELKEGKSIQEISDKLVISNKSIDSITANICTMIEIPESKSSLADWAVSHKHYFK